MDTLRLAIVTTRQKFEACLKDERLENAELSLSEQMGPSRKMLYADVSF